MLRSLVLLPVALVALVGLTVAAGASNPAKGADIYGVGGGSFADKFANFDLSMHTGPNGDFGHVHLKRDATLAPIDLYVDVSCVSVPMPPTAAAAPIPEVAYSGRVSSVSPVPNFLGLQPGNAVSGYVSDGGNPSTEVPVDSVSLITEAVLPDCKIGVYRPPANNVTSGNINIKLG